MSSHARIVAWVSDATISSVSLGSTAAKLGTRTCRPLQTKFLQLYSFTFSEVSLGSTAAKLGTRTCRPLQTKFLQLCSFTFSEVSLDSTANLGITDRSSISRIRHQTDANAWLTATSIRVYYPHFSSSSSGTSFQLRYHRDTTYNFIRVHAK